MIWPPLVFANLGRPSLRSVCQPAGAPLSHHGRHPRKRRGKEKCFIGRGMPGHGEITVIEGPKGCSLIYRGQKLRDIPSFIVRRLRIPGTARFGWSSLRLAIRHPGVRRHTRPGQRGRHAPAPPRAHPVARHHAAVILTGGKGVGKGESKRWIDFPLPVRLGSKAG
jgi:hypothetical protein